MAESDIATALQKFLDEELAKEGITPEMLECVDLEVEYTPVLPFAGMQLRDACDVIPYGFFKTGELPDRFEVMGGYTNYPVGREALKIMRLRWLLARDAYYAP